MPTWTGRWRRLECRGVKPPRFGYDALAVGEALCPDRDVRTEQGPSSTLLRSLLCRATARSGVRALHRTRRFFGFLGSFLCILPPTGLGLGGGSETRSGRIAISRGVRRFHGEHGASDGVAFVTASMIGVVDEWTGRVVAELERLGTRSLAGAETNAGAGIGSGREPGRGSGQRRRRGTRVGDRFGSAVGAPRSAAKRPAAITALSRIVIASANSDADRWPEPFAAGRIDAASASIDRAWHWHLERAQTRLRQRPQAGPEAGVDATPEPVGEAALGSANLVASFGLTKRGWLAGPIAPRRPCWTSAVRYRRKTPDGSGGRRLFGARRPSRRPAIWWPRRRSP